MYSVNEKIKECEDYPNWIHPFHRTPMDWVNWRISYASSELDKIRDKIKALTRERAWYEMMHYRPMYENDIRNEIHKNGFIIGVKF